MCLYNSSYHMMMYDGEKVCNNRVPKIKSNHLDISIKFAFLLSVPFVARRLPLVLITICIYTNKYVYYNNGTFVLFCLVSLHGD